MFRMIRSKESESNHQTAADEVKVFVIYSRKYKIKPENI